MKKVLIADDDESIRWVLRKTVEGMGFTPEFAEVARIARFIAHQNPEIPYSLLGFAPQFMMTDLPRTSLRHAEDALEAARAAGLRNVHVGNRHLLARQ